MSKDILREKYIDYEIWGIPLDILKEIDLPDSIFHNWIMGMAKYYLQSLSPQGILTGDKIIRPEEIYEFITWARSVLAQVELAKKVLLLQQQTKKN